jgi:hypothetical protein
LGVPLEASKRLGVLVQLYLGEMAEGRVTEIVGEGTGLDGVGLERLDRAGRGSYVLEGQQAFGETPSNLSDLKRVRQPAVEDVAVFG